jgi:hypothetical protein
MFKQQLGVRVNPHSQRFHPNLSSVAVLVATVGVSRSLDQPH